MHPIERLRFVARAAAGDQRMLVAETAAALRGLRLDPPGLVVACRRIVERHPTSGPLWWLCAHLLHAPDPFAASVGLAADVENDPTPDRLIELLPEDATVCVVGWPDLTGEALLRRGDVRVLAVDAGGDGSALARRLGRAGSAAEVVDSGAVGAAAAHSDLVIVEAAAAAPVSLLATSGSRAAAAVAWTAGIPTWAVVGHGRILPQGLFATMLDRLGLLGADPAGSGAPAAAGDLRAPWQRDTEEVPLGLCSGVVGPGGLAAVDGAGELDPECPMAHELVRASPM